jgi:hypothetical protein
MDLVAQKLIARQFYEKNCMNLFEAIFDNRFEFFTPIIEKVASVEILELTPLKIKIERVGGHIPQSVFDAFARHFWYSQWNFADLFLVKVPIDGQSFFFLFHNGVCADAWDNSTRLVEIFAEQGEFVGGTHSIYDGAVDWIEEQFTHEDCRDGRTNAFPPPWPGDDSDARDYGALWSESILIEMGARTVTHYYLPNA